MSEEELMIFWLKLVPLLSTWLVQVSINRDDFLVLIRPRIFHNMQQQMIVSFLYIFSIEKIYNHRGFGFQLTGYFDFSKILSFLWYCYGMITSCTAAMLFYICVSSRSWSQLNWSRDVCDIFWVYNAFKDVIMSCWLLGEERLTSYTYWVLFSETSRNFASDEANWKNKPWEQLIWAGKTRKQIQEHKTNEKQSH